MPPTTYGFNSDIESSPDVGLQRRHPVPLRDMRSGTSAQSSETSRSVSEALFVQQKEDQSESRANWIGYMAVATDEGVAALSRRDIVVAWRGAVKIYTGVSKNVDFK
jgi:hypothetical protein